MKEKDIIVITATDLDLLEDLQDWLKSEFEITSAEKHIGTQVSSLGDSTSGIAVIFDFIRNNLGKLISLLKNWAVNYNRDIELTFEHGNKKVTIKCPAKRVTDAQIDEVFSTLNDFFD